MTIALGILTREGPLLATDSQYTSASKANRDKILLFTEDKTGICFALTGNEANAKMAIQECFTAIRGVPPNLRTVDGLRTVIRRTIKPIHDEYVDRIPIEDRALAAFDFVIAIATRAEPKGRLFYTESGAVVETDRFVCRGSGGYIAEYFVQQTYDPNMMLASGMMLAMQALAIAKDHDAHCGGFSQFARITDGTVSGLVPYDVSQTESNILRYQQLAFDLLLAVGDTQLRDEAFHRAVEEFVSGIGQLRESIHTLAHEWMSLVDALDRRRLDAGAIRTLMAKRDQLRAMPKSSKPPQKPKARRSIPQGSKRGR